MGCVPSPLGTQGQTESRFTGPELGGAVVLPEFPEQWCKSGANGGGDFKG